MDKKIIYCVYEDVGIYEDRYQKLLKAFFDKNKAGEFMKQKEAELKEEEIQYVKYCSKCQVYQGLIPIGCKKYKESEKNGCENRVNHVDETSYYIEEIEVE